MKKSFCHICAIPNGKIFLLSIFHIPASQVHLSGGNAKLLGLCGGYPGVTPMEIFNTEEYVTTFLVRYIF